METDEPIELVFSMLYNKSKYLSLFVKSHFSGTVQMLVFRTVLQFSSAENFKGPCVGWVECMRTPHQYAMCLSLCGLPSLL